MVKENNVIWHSALLRKCMCVSGVVMPMDRQERIGRENSAGFVIYRNREVRWAGS